MNRRQCLVVFYQAEIAKSSISCAEINGRKEACFNLSRDRQGAITDDSIFACFNLSRDRQGAITGDSIFACFDLSRDRQGAIHDDSIFAYINSGYATLPDGRGSDSKRS